MNRTLENKKLFFMNKREQGETSQCLLKKNGGKECKELCTGCFEMYKVSAGQEKGEQPEHHNLKQEIERLKSILRIRQYWIWKGSNTDLDFNEWGKQFMQDNNL